jgi:hypothetical protein
MPAPLKTRTSAWAMRRMSSGLGEKSWAPVSPEMRDSTMARSPAMAAAWAWTGRKVARTRIFSESALVSDLAAGLHEASRAMSGRMRRWHLFMRLVFGCKGVDGDVAGGGAVGELEAIGRPAEGGDFAFLAGDEGGGRWIGGVARGGRSHRGHRRRGWGRLEENRVR